MSRYVPPFSYLRYGQHELVLPSTPHGSSNYVLIHPDLYSKALHGNRKSYGRGKEGYRAARAHYDSLLNGFLAAHDWQMPDEYRSNLSCGTYHIRSYITDPSIVVYWEVPPVWRQQGDEFDPDNYFWVRVDGRDVEVQVPPAMWQLYRRSPEGRSAREVSNDWARTFPCVNTSQADLLRSALENPAKLVAELWPDVAPLLAPSEPAKVQWGQLSANETGPGTHAFGNMDAQLMLNPEVTKELLDSLAENVHTLACLFRAFGARLDMTLGWEARKRNRIEKVDISVWDPTHEEGHVITLHREHGIKVECDFRNADEKYTHYQQAQAQAFLDELIGEEKVPTRDEEKVPTWDEFVIDTKERH